MRGAETSAAALVRKIDADRRAGAVHTRQRRRSRGGRPPIAYPNPSGPLSLWSILAAPAVGRQNG